MLDVVDKKAVKTGLQLGRLL